ncbi:MAG: class I SAM-dependent methyltransferase [Actinomycetota bacterium]|nr:class I SAM-dependent methyltransferase [Actinomycetota bacterium]
MIDSGPERDRRASPAAEGAVTAIDTHPPFLARLRELADAAGIGHRIQTLQASMEKLPLPDASADLVWAEGSAYVMGFDAALAA